MPALTSRKFLFPFVMITSLFFLWGFIHNLNPVLIPHLKRSFTLSTTQSTLIDSAVYFAYFVLAIPAGLIMKKYGYKAGIIVGLILFASGCFCFIPAANLQSYAFFLSALFIIASGLTMLETAANPYASALGDPDSAAQRLNFSQSFNGLAAALAPVIGVNVILTKSFTEEQLADMSETARSAALASEASSVKLPYLVLGLALVLVAVIFFFLKLPRLQEGQEHAARAGGLGRALRHRHLKWAVITQFFYVGAQVCVLSLFLLYAPAAAGINETRAGYFLGACGIAFLVGRFAGTAIMQYVAPQKLLRWYASVNVFLSLLAIFASGMITVYAVIGICFFMSIMFPTIFALGIRNLRADTEYGSSLIIMSIVGGAILPLGFGQIADLTGNIQLGYFVPLICFAVVAYFGWKGYEEQKSISNSE